MTTSDLSSLLGDSTRIRILSTLLEHNQIYRNRLSEYSDVDPRRVDIHVAELDELNIAERRDDMVSLNKDSDVVQNLAETKFAFSEYLETQESE